MAAYTEKDGKTASSSDVDLLLHPELMSQEFLQLVLCGKNVSTRGCDSRDRLTELYLQHVIPLPQRRLPDSRWGRRMEKSRGRQSSAGTVQNFKLALIHLSFTIARSSNDHSRKRPLIVFDGTSSHSGPLKVKKPEGTVVPPGVSDRLKPPPAANLSNPVRKISGNTSSSSSSSSSLCSTDTANLKREANSTDEMHSPESKKKISHVTWP
ncbi:Ashwin [Dissostichus eleginoides]|uniref:Ashwin n=1 Tax=Dissostichus eleginoides TaxID=100907 RepID=A0AAD9CK03_DISEL|nr:Ashwin [Dissostichus eleginoides]